MAMYINTNLMSLNAQQNLNTSTSALATSMQRLSSGLRINSAKDDSAGLAISDAMTSQINGMNQAVQNANNAINMAQTTEGALQEVTNNLQSIRSLAVESANATNSSTDRANLDAQVQQALQAIDQIAKTTQFNGQNVLDGTFGTAQFQVGANVGDSVTVNLSTSMATSAIGQTATYIGGAAYTAGQAIGQQGAGSTAALTTGDLTINSVAVGAATAGNAALGQSSSSAYAAASAINSAGITGVQATADTTAQMAWTDVVASAGYSLSVNGTAIYNNTNGPITGSAAAAAINSQSANTGVTATFANGVMTLNNASGGDVALSQTTATAADEGQGLGSAANVANSVQNNSTNAALDMTTTATTATTATFVGSVQLSSSNPIVIGGNTPGSAGFSAGTLNVTGSLGTMNVKTTDAANQMINAVDAAIQQVDSLRSTLGAIQNRFQSVVNSLSTTSQNLTSSRASIMDTNFASETANMTQNQILQQAGTAILAQANANPQLVLKLLQ